MGAHLMDGGGGHARLARSPRCRGTRLIQTNGLPRFARARARQHFIRLRAGRYPQTRAPQRLAVGGNGMRRQWILRMFAMRQELGIAVGRLGRLTWREG